ncbi:alpha/beta hydrolase [Saccharothrix sp. Mg75]|uniref:alpha/beta hydrolase n=1 Tax=Saccharothrix sp. Mg75 TaxID=3445357 RepID=UPI003EE89D7E
MIRYLPAIRYLPVLACLAVPVWLVASRWSAVSAAHPAYLVLACAVAVAGAPLVARARRRAWVSVPLAVLLVAPLAYLHPFPAGRVPADVVDGTTSVALVPPGTPRAGLVFWPGARVDHRAYLPLLAPLARDGTLVVVVKPLLDVPLLSVDAARDVLDAHPDVPAWAVGGHSLGGVAAARYALSDDRVRGLLLWASYPVDDLSARTGLAAWSVSGERDGFTTPADVEASRSLLPPGTRYEVVPGAVHAHFGDYGDQPGDGTPTTSRAAAQVAIVRASAAALREVG